MQLHMRAPAAGIHRPPARRLRIAARAALLAAVAFAAVPCGAQDGLEFNVTLGTDPSDSACGTDTTLDVTRLDLVNVCYSVTNHSNVTLNYHSLADDVSGSLLSAEAHVLAPGASYRYNRVIVARDTQTPTATWTAYDVHPGYALGGDAGVADRVFADGFDGTRGGSVYDFVDIVGTGTPLDMEDDDTTTDVAIGFPFSFYGQSADHIMVGYNGGLLFDLSRGYFTPQNTPLPNADIGAAILPYWTDIYYQQPADGNIYVATLGSAPNRRFVVEWFNLPVMIGGIQQDSATFEAILYEGSNEILFQYADTNVGDPARDDGITATIGLNAPAGVEAALQYSYKTASVSEGTAILFTPTHPVTLSASRQVAVNVGVPKIAVNPARLDVAAAAGATTTAPLTISNVGNRPLTWNLGTVAPAAHFPPVSPFTLPQGDPATSSGLPAPHPWPAKPARTTAAAVPLASGVPAFAIDFDSASLVSVDATDPSAPAPIGGIGDLLLPAGAFVDEDFSKLYAIDWYTWNLLTIDTSTAKTSVIGTAVLQNGSGVNWNSLAWDATTRTLYAAASVQTRSGFSSFLYTIDPLTAAATLVGPISGIGDAGNGTLVAAIAIDSQGLMYGIDLIADDFVAIDKTSGAGAVIASLGFDANFAQGLDFDDYTGTLYYAAFNRDTARAEMYTINPASGALTLISTIGADPYNTQLAAFAIARLGGVCAYPNRVPWLSFDSGRGTTDAGANTTVSVRFDAGGLAAGAYDAHVCIANNDQTNRRVAVPVHFTVN
jgi:hypothetical protein